MTASDAAVTCGMKQGGRLAVFVKREELNELKLKINTLDLWIGLSNIL